MDLVDLNLALALLHERHPHSERATAWLSQRSEPASLLLCRVVQMGALRLTTQASVMREDVLDAPGFWKSWDRLLLDDRFALVENEPSSLERAWRELCATLPTGKVADTDTYLAAFAIAGGFALATFDGGFVRFKGLKTEILR